MNIFERIDKLRVCAEEYEELYMFPESAEAYFESYDVDNKSIDDMMKEFFYVYGAFAVTNKDFVCVAESLGYKRKQTCVDGRRFYTLVKG